MSEQYRLVFSGEVLEGQHPAVVKKRLNAILKLADERLDVLFSGKAVVVKKAADPATAARYQSAFKKAGARLRVLPVEGDENQDELGAAVAQSSARASAQDAHLGSGGEPGLSVLPPGSDLLDPSERPAAVPAEIDTDHLSVQGAVFLTDDDDPAAASAAPNVDHITLAELGAMLGGGQAGRVVVAEIDAEFDLAEVGAILGALEKASPNPAHLKDVNFEVAEPGADLGARDKPAPPPAPDTSHIRLDDEH